MTVKGHYRHSRKGAALAVKGHHPVVKRGLHWQSHVSTCGRKRAILAVKGQHPCGRKGATLAVKGQHPYGSHRQSKVSTPEVVTGSQGSAPHW